MRIVLKESKKIVPLLIMVLFFLTICMNNYPYMTKVILYPLYRELKKESIISESRNFCRAESQSIIVYFKDVSQESIKMIEDNAEKSLTIIMRDFHYVPRGKISIIVYPEYDEMANRTGLGTGNTAMGVYYGGIVSILEPGKWINNGDDVVWVFNREGPVLHEFTHYVLDYISAGNIPVWFTEGAALYEEYRVNGVEWGGSRNYSQYYTVKELEKNFYGLDEVKAYRQSFLVVKHIGENFGMESIVDIAKQLGLGKSMDQAVKRVLDMDVHELFQRSLLE